MFAKPIDRRVLHAVAVREKLATSAALEELSEQQMRSKHQLQKLELLSTLSSDDFVFSKSKLSGATGNNLSFEDFRRRELSATRSSKIVRERRRVASVLKMHEAEQRALAAKLDSCLKRNRLIKDEMLSIGRRATSVKEIIESSAVEDLFVYTTGVN